MVVSKTALGKRSLARIGLVTKLVAVVQCAVVGGRYDAASRRSVGALLVTDTTLEDPFEASGRATR
jgi:hypothetical protein